MRTIDEEGLNLRKVVDRISENLEQMPRKRALKLEVADGIREIKLGAYKDIRQRGQDTSERMNRRIRNRTSGGVGGRGK